MTDQTSKHTDIPAPSAPDVPPAAPTAQPRRRMPTGLKIAIGCIVVSFGAVALLAVVLGVGGFWLKGKADESLGEFTWTGNALRSAWRDANAPDAYRGTHAAGDPVMTANIELARRHGDALAAMDRTAEEPNPSVVLGLAQAWSHGLPAPADFTP